MFGFTLNELINKFGQDLKNKQWLIEPLSNIIISLCVIDTGFKRYKNIKDEEHKRNTVEVLRLSTADHYYRIIKNAQEIIAYLDNVNGDSNLFDSFNKWNSKLNYHPDVIGYKEAVVKTLYKYEKYYLDKIED